jgi:hypothetical protein
VQVALSTSQVLQATEINRQGKVGTHRFITRLNPSSQEEQNIPEQLAQLSEQQLLGSTQLSHSKGLMGQLVQLAM